MDELTRELIRIGGEIVTALENLTAKIEAVEVEGPIINNVAELPPLGNAVLGETPL